jgi:NADH-quinone oxidoreductase subunit E
MFGEGASFLKTLKGSSAIRDGETTADKEFSIERVACVGCCALAPVTVVGEQVHGHMAPSKVEGLDSRVRDRKATTGKRKRPKMTKEHT